MQEVIDVVQMEDISLELVFNWDQTGLNLVPASTWTMAAKWVELKGLTDKRKITAVFCETLMGDSYPFN